MQKPDMPNKNMQPGDMKQPNMPMQPMHDQAAMEKMMKQGGK
jgi:hypothetical protein